MERLPRELLDAVLEYCVARGYKNDILDLRLVCRAFDAFLKPFACRTIGLEYSRLSKASKYPRPQRDALQTIGYHCKSLYIDLMVLRDDLEVEFLNNIFSRIPSMADFCRALQEKYCMNERSFTETEYYEVVEEVLFYCRDVERLRLNLPFQLVGRHCNAATMILAITFKALANRPEEDSAYLRTLVLENVTDIAICQLWLNPIDVMNIMRAVSVLEQLVITIRRHEVDPTRVGLFGSCLWNLVENAECLQSLCLIGMDQDERPFRGTKQTKFWQMPIGEWKLRSLPAPHIIMSSLARLELRRIEVSGDVFIKVLDSFGATLHELYLNEVYLKTEQSRDWSQDLRKVLWVGIPNQRPGDDCQWMAMTVRCACPRLRICRASSLAYDHYLREDVPVQAEFDQDDPGGLKRSLAQRFVEVATGIEQPPSSPDGEPMVFLPQSNRHDHLTKQLIAREPNPSLTHHDTNAYQRDITNSTSQWQKSIDGIFSNCNTNTLDELHYIAETACQGMSEVHRRRSEIIGETGMTDEYTENALEGPPGA
ncbi:hypothetical protein S40285_00892 [Stachybotrys chlorohalonatus IBT 40285]|uniref:F-box domain-containing protein n=1 Tax=Stachybotrys chlorohalonatus (strain IBT 40285) TaxID=1283841 RepID=A0A084QJP2_STAC4|nr:hypothetical protein S40285_00892 [Stachybotrys chlorohalonata IBT 40285]